jgi:hypothetical protein
MRQLILGAGSQAVPLRDLSGLAELLGVEVVERDLAAGTDGCQALLIPTANDTFRLVVDPTPRSGWPSLGAASLARIRRHRIRFRVAHELGHTIFYKRAPGQTPRRVAEGGPHEEAFCDAFARALLLPDRAVRNCASVVRLVRVAQRYDVSIEVAARALGEIESSDVALFYWSASVQSPAVQWSNLQTTSRLERWRSAVGRALRVGASLAAPDADGLILAARRQAVVVAKR